MSAPDAKARGSAGFSTVELVVAVLILAVGVLGLAGTTGYVIRTVSLAEVNTERAAAVQSAIERLRALPFDQIASGSEAVGPYEIEWTSDPSGAVATARTKWIEIVTTGPGLQSVDGGLATLSPTAVDTFNYVITRR